MLYLDTETVGLHGPIVLMQYAQDDESVTLHNTWLEPIIDTTRLIEYICTQQVCAFNLAFDWFHLCQLYTTLVLLGDKVGYTEAPVDHIDTYAELEPLARDGKCLKPAGALDLLLYSKRGPYQSTMDRKNIIVKKVPIQMADQLAAILEERVELKDLYFARSKDKRRWHVRTIKGNADFVDLVLKFNASAALKVIVRDALGIKDDDVLLFTDISVSKKLNPVEAGWAPFALALSDKKRSWYTEIKVKGVKKKGLTWPGVIKHHIDHWAFNKLAQEYGTKDVVYLQQLKKHYERICPDSPPTGDDTDSILACMVGAVRWHGYAVDLEALRRLEKKYISISLSAPKAPAHVHKYLDPYLSAAEREAISKKVQLKEGEESSTKKVVLEAIAKLGEADCPKCKGTGCADCNNGAVPHPAAARAQQCLDARQATTKLGVIRKLLKAGRFHVSTNVIGALSGRMSGRDGLNATGIDHTKEFRSVFTLAFDGFQLSGGDFVSYEVAIADARYNDPKLRAELLRCWSCGHSREVSEYEALYCPGCQGCQDKCIVCSYPVIVKLDGTILRGCKCQEPLFGTKCKKCGKKAKWRYNGEIVEVCDCQTWTPNFNREDSLQKIHGLFAMGLYPGESYVDILLTKGANDDHYDKGKRGLFSQLYGGNYNTLMNRLNIDEETARSAELWFASEFPGVGQARNETADKFCSMRQPNGIGTSVVWHEPADYCESLNGYRRFFTLENKICHTLFELASDPPEGWKKIKAQVIRRDRVQKIGGAVQSALYAAAFNIQSKNTRAASNHEIQSTGARETKDLQKDIWDLQPCGVNDWIVIPMQVHDEVMCPVKPAFVEPLEQKVNDFVTRRKSLIPLLRIDWSRKLNTWADK